MTGLSWSQIHRIAGYIECGEGSTVKFSQDDATKEWVVRIGEERFTGTLVEAFTNALAAANKHYKDVYDMGPV